MKKIIWVLILTLSLGISCKKKESSSKRVESEKSSVSGEQTAKLEPEAMKSSSWKFEMGVLRADGTGGTVITYIDGKNRRIEQYEGVGENKKLKNISLSTEEASWILNVEEKKGMKMPPEARTPEQTEEPPPIPKWSAIVESASKNPGITTNKLGIDEWEGKKYTVYHLTYPAANAIVDYYVDENDVIKRVLSYDPEGKLVEDARLELTLGPLSADLFKVPAGYQISEMAPMAPKEENK